jgi:hypothetical protein
MIDSVAAILSFAWLSWVFLKKSKKMTIDQLLEKIMFPEKKDTGTKK